MISQLPNFNLTASSRLRIELTSFFSLAVEYFSQSVETQAVLFERWMVITPLTLHAPLPDGGLARLQGEHHRYDLNR